ncbi:MAG TPA: FHA domain-containing protein [Streptosporangiaceae bacterium]|nr:FHA domain-containing protein [Streptosporangiaceae bacterium]
MPTCPAGHDSADADFCDVCGMRIGGAAEQAPGSAGPAAPEEAAGGSPAQLCPQCGNPKTGQFCEACGYDFTSPAAPAGLGAVPFRPAAGGPEGTWTGLDPAAPDPAAGTDPGLAGAPEVAASTGPQTVAGLDPGAPGVAGTDLGAAGTPGPVVSEPAAAPDGAATGAGTTGIWVAVVTADRDYYDNVVAAGGPDAAGIEFPGYCPQRRFRLSGQEMRIGRRSVSRGLEPEIDLTGPPTDPGVSHLHAVLIAQSDGGWAVLDPGSSNGTMVNDHEIAQGVQVALHDGDHINLGAWTMITIGTA